jgi:septum formation protein
VAFEVAPADVEEETAGEPRAVAERNALAKAQAAAREGTLVLGVDTIVVLDAEIFGKPADEPGARAMLSRLSGRTHEVISGIAVVEDGGEPRVSSELTKVTFRALDDAWLDWYLATGEWRERAGGYAIQGAGTALVTRIDGEYANVVGLPVASLLSLVPTLLGVP